jgi:hypothetical protein
MFILMLFTVFTSTSNGQESKNFTLKGTKEFGGSISYQRITPVVAGSSAGSNSIFSFTPFIGYFLDSGFELGINPVEIITIKQLGYTTTQVLAFLAPSYNFIFSDKIFPFIEAQIGFAYKAYNEYTEKGISYGGRTGIKIGLAKRGLLNLSLQYIRITLNPKDATGRYGFNQFLMSAGWTVWY